MNKSIEIPVFNSYSQYKHTVKLDYEHRSKYFLESAPVWLATRHARFGRRVRTRDARRVIDATAFAPIIFRTYIRSWMRHRLMGTRENQPIWAGCRSGSMSSLPVSLVTCGLRSIVEGSLQRNSRSRLSETCVLKCHGLRKYSCYCAYTQDWLTVRGWDCPARSKCDRIYFRKWCRIYIL